ncbi:MAG: DUF4143 domain-containing protein [Armatimonadetes bacterium]|nr:DUF4143 domain-containing protein [Armatimonadota bacterium]
MLHALQGVQDRNDLVSRPWGGASWEGYVIEQILGTLSSKGILASPYFFRTSDQYELDLLLEFGSQRWAIEIELTTAPSVAHLEHLDKVADMVGATHRFLISQTTKPTGGQHRASCNLSTFLERLTGND